jgi:hypothetical protein
MSCFPVYDTLHNLELAFGPESEIGVARNFMPSTLRAKARISSKLTEYSR